ncbi:hypothetical protein LZC95_20670 [Pendulispora brunnea]|uniref:ABC transporter permease n=1 Tax=Pendulispora brunnea TaxID=2905690 RepID=A0ABZ2KL34_9BACT
MAVASNFSLVRAVIASHAQGAANRMRREMGRRGLVIMVLLMTLLVTVLVIPLVGWAATIGYFGGKYITEPFMQRMLGLFLLMVSFGGGVLSGTTGGGRQIAWESYRAFPVRHAALFAAELVASLLDLVPLMLSAMVIAHVVALGIALPRAVPVLALVTFETIGFVLITQTVISSLAAALLRRLRIAFSALMGAIGFASLIFASAVEGPAPSLTAKAVMSRMTQARAAIEVAAEWFPGTWGIRSVRHAANGNYLAALAEHTYPLGVLLVGVFFASRLMAREVASGGIVASAQASRLWSFRSPAYGVARLTWLTLMDSALGRVGLIAPLLTIVLIRLPLLHWLGTGLSTPGAYAYVALSTSAIQLNQFGLDGHGIKSLFLLPVSTEDLFRGKSWGLATYFLLQAVLLALLFALVQKTPTMEIVAGSFLGGAFFLTQNMVGRWTSAWLPRRLPRRDMRGTGAPGALLLVSLALTVSTGAAFGGLYAACQRFAPAWLVPVNVTVFTGLLILDRLTRPIAVRYFEERRERVLEAIG